MKQWVQNQVLQKAPKNKHKIKLLKSLNSKLKSNPWNRKNKKKANRRKTQRIKCSRLFKQLFRRIKKLLTKSISWNRRLRKLKLKIRRVKRKWLRLSCRNSRRSKQNWRKRRKKLISIYNPTQGFKHKLKVLSNNFLQWNKLLQKQSEKKLRLKS